MFGMAGSVFSAGPVSLDMRWQPGHLQLMRMGTLAADLARLQTQAQWMQVGILPLGLESSSSYYCLNKNILTVVHCV